MFLKIASEREVLQELLSWENVSSKMSVIVADESQEDPKRGLTNKYDMYLQQKEEENRHKHKIHRLLSQVPQS